MKEKDKNNPFIFWGLGTLDVKKKTYWLILGILAVIEIGLGISVFFR